MTNDKPQNRCELLLPEPPMKPTAINSRFQRSKPIQRKITKVQLKKNEQSMRKCPMAQMFRKQQQGSCPIDFQRREEQEEIESEFISHPETPQISENLIIPCVTSCSPSSLVIQDKIKHEEMEQEQLIICSSPSHSSFVCGTDASQKIQQSSNHCNFSITSDDQQQQQLQPQQQPQIRNRVSQEPVLFLHNKWDILPNKDYNIFGDILIETDFVSDKKFSSQNHWKPPLNVEMIPNRLLAKMNIGSYGQIMKDFSIISNFMKMCTHDEIQLYAANLDKWQRISNKLVLSKSNNYLPNSNSNNNNQNSSFFCHNNNNISTALPSQDTAEESTSEQQDYSSRLSQFEKNCNETIDSLNADGRIFMYSKKRYNNFSNNLEEYECGFNQYLLAIMGCENDHLPAIVMRQGRPNIFDSKSRLKISQQLLLNYLNIEKSMSEQINIFSEFIQAVNLITFDDLSVPAKATSYCLNYMHSCKAEETKMQMSSNSRTSQESFNSNAYDFVLQIVELDIEAQHISSLMNIREFNDHEHKLQELKENIQYEFDIHILIQKFYQKNIQHHSKAEPEFF